MIPVLGQSADSPNAAGLSTKTVVIDAAEPSSSFTLSPAMLFVSAVAVLGLGGFLAFMLGRFIKAQVERSRAKKRRKREMKAAAAVFVANQKIQKDSTRSSGPSEELLREQADFVQNWSQQSYKDKYDFLTVMSDAFLDDFSPAAFMDTLDAMLREESNTFLWIKMLRFAMRIERDLFHWDQTEMKQVSEGDKTIPSRTHERFQSFLMKHANELLLQYGDVAKVGEEPEAGFMRFIAYLFGFHCKDQRILELMDYTWARSGFMQTDASRAMVWGYKLFQEDPHPRQRGRPTSTEEGEGPHLMWYKIMRELRGTDPKTEKTSKCHHLLFALGCGYEQAVEGPLYHMSDVKNYPQSQHYYGVHYMWLMMGRDFVMANAWEWMCRRDMSEHDRMCNRFGQEGVLYEHVMDTVTKYEQDFNAVDGQTLMAYAMRYNTNVERRNNFSFVDAREWYQRYLENRRKIGYEINQLLITNDPRDCPPAVPDAPGEAVDYYTKIAMQWQAAKEDDK